MVARRGLRAVDVACCDLDSMDPGWVEPQPSGSRALSCQEKGWERKTPAVTPPALAAKAR